MYNFEDYYVASEYDMLIDETLDKIKKGILNTAKEDIEKQTKEVTKLKDELYDAYETSIELNYLINKLEKENAKLKEQLDNKLTEIPHTKFNIGDDVYVIAFDKLDKVVCPSCNGNGYIDINIEKFGNVKILCPDCLDKSYHLKDNNNLKEVSYSLYKVIKNKIEEIKITIDENKIDVSYYIDSHSGLYNEDLIFETLEDAQIALDKLNEERRILALSKLNKEDV